MFRELSLQPHVGALRLLTLRVWQGGWNHLSPPRQALSSGSGGAPVAPAALHACLSHANSPWQLYDGAVASKERELC